MIDSTGMRKVLWLGVLFNSFVALMLMFPSSLGKLAALPAVGSVFYLWMLTFFVVLFSATYAWLALERTISRPVVALAAFGKTGAFVVALVCLLRGEIQLRAFSVSIGDLAFALYFFFWLRSTAASAPNS
jgi:hypothetical protein